MDACSLINQGCSPCIRWMDNQQSHVKCCFKRQCFHILKSHYSVNVTAAVGGGNAGMSQKTHKPSKVNPSAGAAASHKLHITGVK